MNKSQETKKVWLTNQRKAVLVIIAVLLIIALITGIYPYFTSIKNAENVFTIGNIDINLTEGDEWDAAVASGVAPEDAQNIQPGQHITKEPVVQNIGANPAYVYLKVYVPVYNYQDLFTYEINETEGQDIGWTKRDEDMHTTIDGQVYNIYTYEYDEILEPGTETNPLFNEVVFADGMSFTPEQAAALGTSKDIIIKAYAIQAESGVDQATNEITEQMTGDSNEEDGVVARLDIHVGDTVKYNPTGTSTWTGSLAASDGSVSDISMDATDNFKVTTWKVLSIDGDNVQLISSAPVGSLTLQGPQGYNNAVYLLNKVCSELYSSTGITARSLKTEDIEGYMDATALDTARGNTYNTQPYGAYTKAKSWYPEIYASEINSTIDGTTLTSGLGLSEQTTAVTGGKVKAGTSIQPVHTYYGLSSSDFTNGIKSEYDSVKSTLSSMLFSSGNSWVASRCVIAYSSFCDFGVRNVLGGLLRKYNMFDSSGSDDGYSLGLRPVVSLSSDALQECADGGYMFEVIQ